MCFPLIGKVDVFVKIKRFDPCYISIYGRRDTQLFFREYFLDRSGVKIHMSRELFDFRRLYKRCVLSQANS